VYTYYKHLYSKDNNVTDDTIENYIGPRHTDIPKLTDNLKSKCEGEITMPELISYLKQLRNNKSPGISGFTGEFYKFFYNDLNLRLLNSINYTYNIDSLPPTQNIGIMTLIPKGSKDRKLLKNWRPLVLLNTYYKIVSGVLTARLKPALDYLIHADQKAYLQNRYVGRSLAVHTTS